MKKKLISFGIDLLILVGLIFVLSIIIYFIWNTAVVWIVPSLSHMGIMVALGAGTLFVILNNIAHFWANKFLEIKRIKVLESLEILPKLDSDLSFVKMVLYEKKILNEIDFMAMESMKKNKDAR
jgi:hypothetical protein